MSLDQVAGVGGAQRGHEQRQRVDAVFVHVARAVEVVDRRRDVAAGGVSRRPAHRPASACTREPCPSRTRDGTENDRSRVQNMSKWPGLAVNVPAVPARLDAGRDDLGGVARVPAVAEELAAHADAGVVDVFGQDGRADPGAIAMSRPSRGLAGVGRVPRQTSLDGAIGRAMVPGYPILAAERPRSGVPDAAANGLEAVATASGAPHGLGFPPPPE